MSQPCLNVGVIGLGVMGQRMLTRLAAHSRLRPQFIWDANTAAIAQTLKQYPTLKAASSAEDLIQDNGLHSLYIATPPAPHMALTQLAFDAGLAVFCEKPLTVDFDAARHCIARIAAEGQRAAVNFALASSPGLALLQQQFGQAEPGKLGHLQEIELELAFAAWPRPWQAGAGAWLSERIEGGFSREVLSHFIFALQRVLGAAERIHSRVEYPDDARSAETGLWAELQAADVKIRLQAHVGGEKSDHNLMRWRTEAGEIELSEWFSKIVLPSSLEATGASPVELRQASQVDQLDQLDQWVAMIEGHPHGLPGYAEALAVQETIESLLQGEEYKK